MDTEEIARISIERFAEQLRKPEAVLFWEYLDENLSAKEMLVGLGWPTGSAGKAQE